MSISAVGSIATSSGVATLAVNPTNVGDILILTYGISSTGATVSSVSGGGVTTWNSYQSEKNTSQGTAFWWGVVTATGSSTITIVNSSATYSLVALGALQFTSSIAGTWSTDGAGSNNSGIASSGNYPSLTPAGANELYVAMGFMDAGSPTGSTAGFTYINGIGATDSESVMTFVYNVSASNPTAQRPAWGQGGSAPFVVCSGLLNLTPLAWAPSHKPPISAAVARAASWCKRESGLFAPERGLVVPRLA